MCFAFDNKAQEYTNGDYSIEVLKITKELTGKIYQQLLVTKFLNDQTFILKPNVYSYSVLIKNCCVH